MAATFAGGSGAPRPRTVRSRRAIVAVFAVLAAVLAVAPMGALASASDVVVAAADEQGQDSEDVARAPQTESRRRAERRLRGNDGADDSADDAQVSPAMGFGSLLSGRSGLAGRSGLFGTVMLGAAFYFLFMRGRGASSSNAGWGSYYLFWIVAPALLAAVSSHPAFLIVIVVGVLLRRWLPDPILFFKHQARMRSLQTDIDANASNATARRDLAKIWLEKHRPRRALPLLEQAIARDPSSVELLYLAGVAHLQAGQHERAVEALVRVAHREPNFQYGEAYLRAADALIALGRWDDADDALERYVKINSSNIEGRAKRLRVCKARKDASGEQKAKADLKDVWRALPGYQRRKQVGWYLRSLV